MDELLNRKICSCEGIIRDASELSNISQKGLLYNNDL